jgi:hypothetical protein
VFGISGCVPPQPSLLLQFVRCAGRSARQRAALIGDRQYRFSTGQESFSLVKEIAQDWYLRKWENRGAGLLKAEKTVQDVADKFARNRRYYIKVRGARFPFIAADRRAKSPRDLESPRSAIDVTRTALLAARMA